MLSDKKLDKIQKILNKDRLSEIDSLDEQHLRFELARAAGAIKAAKDELQANPKYQQLKEDIKHLSEGMKEISKFQGAIIEYVLHLLEEKA